MNDGMNIPNGGLGDQEQGEHGLGATSQFHFPKVAWAISCSTIPLQSILPSGMSCKRRAEAFARSLQSRLKNLGLENEDDEREHDASLLSSEASSQGSSGMVTTEQPHGRPATLRYNEETGTVICVHDRISHDSGDGEQSGLLASSDSDVFFDFDIESPLSPGEEQDHGTIPLNREEDIHKKLGSSSSNIDEADARESGCGLSTPGSESTFTYQAHGFTEDVVKTISSEVETTRDFPTPEAETAKTGLYVPEVLVLGSTPPAEPPPAPSKKTVSAEEASDDSQKAVDLLSPPALVAENTKEENDDDEEQANVKLRRCISLKSGKTPPGTPSRKKIVRFADALGLDLADVRTFLDELPTVPQSAYKDLEDAAAEEQRNQGLGKAIAASNWRTTHVSSSASAYQTKLVLIPLFQQPAGCPRFMENVRLNKVSLENAVETDMALEGTVRVLNIDYHKAVLIRYSYDNWVTHRDLHASYVPNSCDGFSDKFSFTIYAHFLVEGQKLSFAVCFKCLGQEFWDNNGGRNYTFHCYRKPVPNQK